MTTFKIIQIITSNPNIKFIPYNFSLNEHRFPTHKFPTKDNEAIPNVF